VCEIIFLIRGDSGGKVPVLGDDIICYFSGKKSSYEFVSNSERLRRQSCLNLQVEKRCKL